eukprot:CAMPEP_0185849966 /NCGR_PEP_ID=MMETSP1354-20130828/4272_1 /TAXON_ID=708628 /ORGANISM="Erythrolobus madagascarensis, Strain CCMP3276" /LENGTH=1245 /DNA_ID=CAMNT_0028550583 /DNA_START=12 /DNA_END=3746 /DNA_ORIENTATION=-
MECPVCLENYDTEAHAPMISTSCMHTVCLSCSNVLKSRPSQTCPKCRAKLDTFIKNFAAVEALALVSQAHASAITSSSSSAKPYEAPVANAPAAPASSSLQHPQEDNINNSEHAIENVRVRTVLRQRLNFCASAESELGRGAFARVYHGYLDTSTNVAIKIAAPYDARAAEHVRHEARMLALAHAQQPCAGALFLQLHGLCEDTHANPHPDPLCRQPMVVTELASGGSLLSVIREFRSARMFIPARAVLQLAYSVAQALEALHTATIPLAHRDVKPANILLMHPLFPGAATGLESVHAKLADFGLARAVSSAHARHENLETSAVGSGSLAYLAPEVIAPEDFTSQQQQEQSNARVDDRAADVYAFGVLLWELISGSEAWSSTINRPRASTNPRNGTGADAGGGGGVIDAQMLAEMYGRVVARRERPGNPHLAVKLRGSAGTEASVFLPPEIAALVDHCWQQQPRHRPHISQTVESLRSMLVAVAHQPRHPEMRSEQNTQPVIAEQTPTPALGEEDALSTRFSAASVSEPHTHSARVTAAQSVVPAPVDVLTAPSQSSSASWAASWAESAPELVAARARSRTDGSRANSSIASAPARTQKPNNVSDPPVPSIAAASAGASAAAVNDDCADAGETASYVVSCATDVEHSRLVQRMFGNEPNAAELSWADLLVVLSAEQSYEQQAAAATAPASVSSSASSSTRGVVECGLRKLSKLLGSGDSLTLEGASPASASSQAEVAIAMIRSVRANGGLELLFDRVLPQKESSAAAVAYGLLCALRLLQVDIADVEKLLGKPSVREQVRLGMQPLELNCVSQQLASMCSEVDAARGGENRGARLCAVLGRILTAHSNDSYIQSVCLRLVRRLQFAGGKPWERAIALSSLPQAVLRLIASVNTSSGLYPSESLVGLGNEVLAEAVRNSVELSLKLGVSNAVPWLIRFASPLTLTEIYSGSKQQMPRRVPSSISLATTTTQNGSNNSIVASGSSDGGAAGVSGNELRVLCMRRRAALDALSTCLVRGGSGDNAKRACAVDGAFSAVVDAIVTLSPPRTVTPMQRQSLAYLSVIQTGAALSALALMIRHISKHAPVSASKHAFRALVRRMISEDTTQQSASSPTTTTLISSLLKGDALEAGLEASVEVELDEATAARRKMIVMSQSELRVWIVTNVLNGCEESRLFERVSSECVGMLSLMTRHHLPSFHVTCCTLLVEVAATRTGREKLNSAHAETVLKRVSLKIAKACAKKDPQVG